MKITIKTNSWATRWLKSDTTEIELPENSTVNDLFKKLPLPETEAGITTINGKAAKRETVLADGDIVKIYPVIIGG